MPASLDTNTGTQTDSGRPASLRSIFNLPFILDSTVSQRLLRLVATIKEHITKPTAMAQGRVAHLIEWKGWGGGEAGSRGGAWGRGGAGMEAELQEDAHYYSQMTDEIKEARFAAGVAEQFALAEAAMNMWSMADSLEQPSTMPHNHLLSQFLLDGGSMGVPQHLYSLHMCGEPNVAPRVTTLCHPPPAPSHRQRCSWSPGAPSPQRPLINLCYSLWHNESI
uniref:Family with sequence similarity 131 member C n=1 Tax=Neogobius melanostomus TaxID=47308 RepID=A0A8C6WM89_9GOBI